MEKWQATLGNVEEVVELLAASAKRWSALQVLFPTSDEGQEAGAAASEVLALLPDAAALFRDADRRLRAVMEEAPRQAVVAFSLVEGRVLGLRRLHGDFEQCAAALDGYLEGKVGEKPAALRTRVGGRGGNASCCAPRLDACVVPFTCGLFGSADRRFPALFVSLALGGARVSGAGPGAPESAAAGRVGVRWARRPFVGAQRRGQAKHRCPAAGRGKGARQGTSEARETGPGERAMDFNLVAASIPPGNERLMRRGLSIFVCVALSRKAEAARIDKAHAEAAANDEDWVDDGSRPAMAALKQLQAEFDAAGPVTLARPVPFDQVLL